METAEGGLSQGIAGRGGFTDQPDRGLDLSPMKRSKSQQDLDLGIVGIGGKRLLANSAGFGRGSILALISGLRQALVPHGLRVLRPSRRDRGRPQYDGHQRSEKR